MIDVKKLIKFQIKDVFNEIKVEKFNFPKYSTQFINLANQNAKGTSPSVVGQMSDLIKQIPENTISSWESFYLSSYEDRIDVATNKIREKLEEMKKGYGEITKDMVNKWVYDLIIYKTAEGLIIQEFILMQLSKKFNLKYSIATPQDEAKNIDGYLGDIPVQIKPDTYQSKKTTVRNEINIPIIYYKKTPQYLSIDYTEFAV